jgi:CIC family chloride channel protein
LSEDRIRLLLACGAGAGISATYHAPFTGTLFALEIILGHLEAGYFSAIVISAVVADTIAQGYKLPIIPSIANYPLVSNWELLLYAILGVIIAFSAIAFIKTEHGMVKLWKKIPVSDYLKPALGGLVLGMIGMLTFFHYDDFPRFYGLGYESIAHTLNGQLPFLLVFSLFFIKIFTTSLTIGSGGTGGTFTPTLFMGLMLGSSFGYAVNMLFPGITAPTGAYALAGMAAFFGGAAHAPFTAIMVAFELTQYNYHMILPIMLTTVVATLVAQSITPDSMYTSHLVSKGIKIRRVEPGQELYVMDTVTVEEAMTKDIEVVPLTMSLFQLMEKFDQTHLRGFPVVDEAGELAGMVNLRDLDSAIASGNIAKRTVAEIFTKNTLVAYPSESMGSALQRLGLRGDVTRLPVVEEGSRKLVGIVLRSDIIHAYNKAMKKSGQPTGQERDFSLTKDD